MAEKSLLETLVQYVDESEEASCRARVMSEKARDYYDGIQLTAGEVKTLEARKQPKVIFNRIQPKVDFLLGTERQQRTDPKAYPRTPKHDKAANAVTDAIRFVLDKEDFDVKSSDCFENQLVEGTGGVSVEVEKKGDDIDIVIKRIRWDRFGFDPHSLERDFSDASYTFVVAWKDLSEAKLRWPDKAEDMATQMTHASDTYDDKPNRWFDTNRQRVMFVDMYFIHKGVWHKSIFSKGVFLEEPKPSLYVNEDGEPQNAHIMQSAKVKRDGDRYGAVEGLIDIQDEINKRRSKALHLLSMRQTYSKEGMITNIDAFKKEANKADGHLQFPMGGEFGRDFGILPNEQLVGPQYQMYQEAVQQMDSVSANAALAGKQESTLSGRAIQAQQQGGMIELTPLFDGNSQHKKRVYLAVWDRIKQFWQAEKWIRVTDDEDNLKFVGLNIPVTQAMMMVAEKMQITPEQVQADFPDELQDLHQRLPQLAQQVETANNVAEIDVDIIIEEVPDVVNLQSEQFELMVKMYQANPEGIPWEEIVQMSSLRNKDKILGKELSPEEREAIDAKQAEAEELAQLEKAAMRADIVGTTSKAEKDMADAEATRVSTSADVLALEQLVG